jgi:hypothetical protein
MREQGANTRKLNLTKLGCDVDVRGGKRRGGEWFVNQSGRTNSSKTGSR